MESCEPKEKKERKANAGTQRVLRIRRELGDSFQRLGRRGSFLRRAGGRCWRWGRGGKDCGEIAGEEYCVKYYAYGGAGAGTGDF